MNQPAAQPPIHVRSPEFVGTTPFEGDLFGRKALADRLTSYLDRLKDGCVVGVDAPWGEGKSWFGRNWQAQLAADGYNTIYVDAFERDYLDDPFPLLASEIVLALDAKNSGDVGKSLLEASLKLGKTLLPAAAKMSINTLGRLFLGTLDLAGDAGELANKLDDKFADASEKYVASRIAAVEEEKKSVAGFREALTQFAAAQAKPVVFFIDELDRCRPDFAVRIIERVKHFFDVPNLVFVLLLNRDQLERAVQGVYGQGCDAHAYLGKFVHLFLSLPKKKSFDTGQSNSNWIYAWKVAQRYQFRETQQLENFIGAYTPVATALGMSLRDVEKAFALLAMANANAAMDYLAWPIVLKLRYPNTFAQLLDGSKSAHREAADILTNLDLRGSDVWIRDYFHALHLSIIKGQESLGEDQKTALKDYAPRNHLRSPTDLIRFWLRMIDVAIQD
ncbi:MAG TPA: P-loop NTPase fold protein [Rhodocyclaceae bacterium]|nr:P-loop NTPase fold protein [Rhodocyclaceae bacterium]